MYYQRNESVRDTMCQWPQFKARYNQWNGGSLDIGPNLLKRVVLHESQQENVCVVPKGTPCCLIKYHLREEVQPRRPMKHIFKESFTNLIPVVTHWSMCNQSAIKDNSVRMRLISPSSFLPCDARASHGLWVIDDSDSTP